MKQASAAAQTIIASGLAVKAELFDITLTTGQIYRFTSFQTPVTAGIYSGGVVGPAHLYGTGLNITRESITQKCGVEAGNMKLKLAPQPDSPFSPVLINGYPLLQACRLGFLDGATIQLSKLFMNNPIATNGQLDTSPGAVGWFLGTAQDVQPNRLAVDITVDDYLAYMSTQQMPRTCWQTGCFHRLYDTGCDPAQTLKASKTVSGSITAATDGAHFTTNLTQADHYFELGTLTFTSGVNNGLVANVASYLNSGGAVVVRVPFPVAPAPSDTFIIWPGCDKQQATCVSKFSNLAHFGGCPYIPVPETILDGGTSNPPAQQIGQQAGQIIGSYTSGKQYPSYPGFYKP